MPCGRRRSGKNIPASYGSCGKSTGCSMCFGAWHSRYSRLYCGEYFICLHHKLSNEWVQNLFLSLTLSFSICHHRWCSVMQPLCLGGLVSYFVPGQTELTKSDAYWYATGIVMCALLMVVSFHPFILWVFRISAKLRLGCSGLIYQKTLKLSKSSIEDGLNGKVINILSTDLAKFDTGLAFAHDIWKGPMETIVFAYFIYLELDIFGMVGVAFLTCFVPLQGENSGMEGKCALKLSIYLYLFFFCFCSLDWQESSTASFANGKTYRFPCSCDERNYFGHSGYQDVRVGGFICHNGR